MVAAAALGHTADQIRPMVDRRVPSASSSASSPDSSSFSRSASAASLVSTSTGMATNLLAQLGGDLAGQRRDFGRIDSTGTLDLDRELRDDLPRPARQQH